MMKYKKTFFIILIILLSSHIIVYVNVKGCKDIVAVGDATDGEYNLLLKVRDPSRIGLQVLCIVPEGYGYTYHHPWTGKPLEFEGTHRYIGVCTKGDTIPNIVKAGMALNDAGISFGDADTGSNWLNPTRHAWDDFDWIRYACEKADDEDVAVKLLTEDAVDQLHASGVSENLFVVGPKKAFVIEADAFHYTIREIDDVFVISNYPKELWRTQSRKKLPIASSFDVEKDKYVRRGQVVRLRSLYGVKVVDIGEDWIIARQVPFLKINDLKLRVIGERVKIKLGERETVGDYSVRLLDIDGNKARISVCYVYKAWEDKMLEYIQSKQEDITVKDMMNWSRLHKEDLEGLRPMCQDVFTYESVMIYKIPTQHYSLLSSGWFSANHACSSIYVPIHISNNDIYEPYRTGEAAELSLELLESYGHGTLASAFSRVEDVFLNENQNYEEIADTLIGDASTVIDFLTITDMAMQQQAMLTQQIWLEVYKSDIEAINQIDVINSIWRGNYSLSLDMMENAIHDFTNVSGSSFITDYIVDIVFSICESRIDAAESLGKNISTLEEGYDRGKKLITTGDYDLGFNYIKTAFKRSTMLLEGQDLSNTVNDENIENYQFWIVSIVILIGILCITIFILLIRKKMSS